MRNTVVMLVLAILAAATWVATWPPQNAGLPKERSANEGPLGYYLRGARLFGTDDEGRVTYRVRAERLDEVPDEARLRLEGVAVEYQPPDNTAWAISAATGSVPKDGSLLDLRGNVEIRSTPSDGSNPITINTEQLRFSPESSSAESDERVRVRVGDWHFEAVGLSTHLKGDALELESQVHGTFSR
ncbi:MAG TPA: LPS export ABC transporter periplasmic protein LptC [Gammaproteobacteria bacterium]|nr:LPS export ABC transporter periplasmic protein LptC [Gammaproteobacteria bacterium]